MIVDMEEKVERVSIGFRSGRTLPIENRLEQLRKLTKFLVEEENGLLEALRMDFKSHYDALSEIRSLQSSAVEAVNQLKSWSQPEYVSRPLVFMMDSCSLQWEPRGVVLIISAWNYPIDILLGPLIGAISAGCTTILKPSELSLATSNFLTSNLPKYLDEDWVSIIPGGPEETGALLEWPRWDLIFFTGSARIGRIVQQTAAVNLIPTVLELGGKSPCIVLDDVDLEVVAKRIIFGKLFNAGQTCIAPDYVLAMDPIKLTEKLIMVIKKFYGEDPSKSSDYSRIVNHHHWDRLTNLVKECSSEVIQVGESDRETRYFAPTIVQNPHQSCTLMSEEIFGPILPILPIHNIMEAINFINGRPIPLATYLFTSNKEHASKFLTKCRAGGVTINDTMMHIFSGVLPLGGLGASGTGRYKGRWSFETFSHQKPIMWKSLHGEVINDISRNPPLDEKKFALVAKSLFYTPSQRHTG